MSIPFDPGYGGQPYADLVADYPDETVYPTDAFRVEWGPVFHRGRLDGSARILVIGQDPAAHEAIARRILVGEAGQRAQGLLAKLGITSSYVLVNTFLYSVYGQSGGEKHVGDTAITAYRNAWFDALAQNNSLDAVLTFGHLAQTAFEQWQASPGGAAANLPHAAALHPTYPDSASRSHGANAPTKAEAMKRLCDSWNAALALLGPIVHADVAVPLAAYGDALTPADLAPIPSADLPPGIPSWMRSLDAWAVRTGADPMVKRATITVTVPTKQRPWAPG